MHPTHIARKAPQKVALPPEGSFLSDNFQPVALLPMAQQDFKVVIKHIVITSDIV
ncbi:MAG: hypothetical protein WCK86_08645 [Planctomycetia bacterium]